MQGHYITNISRISVDEEQNYSNVITVSYLNELTIVRQLTQTWLVPLIVLIGTNTRMHNTIHTCSIHYLFCFLKEYLKKYSKFYTSMLIILISIVFFYCYRSPCKSGSITSIGGNGMRPTRDVQYDRHSKRECKRVSGLASVARFALPSARSSHVIPRYRIH